MTQSPPSGGIDLTFLYQIIRDMDAKLDRLAENFVTVREFTQLELRVKALETRWRANIGWLIALVGALASVAYLIVYLVK